MLTCLIVLRRRSSTTRRARAGAGGAGSGRVARGRGRPRRVVCCASSRLLRLFLSAALLHPPLRLFSRTVEGQEAQQRERGAADAGADGPAVIDVHGATVPLTSSAPLAPPVSPRTRTDRRAAWSGDSERRPARIFPPPPRGSHHHHTPARTLEGYSGVVLKTWGVKVVVAVCSGGSSSSGGLLRGRPRAFPGCDAGGGVEGVGVRGRP